MPFGDHEALRAAIGPETAAVMIEPIQGEGGVRPVPPQCLRGLRALCDEHGLLLIMDEVQTGVGRTGRLFAHEWSGVAPDIMSAAKGIGGGFPLGACLATREAARGMVAGSHGTTFGGNPLAMAVGNAVLDVVLGDGFLEQVQRVGPGAEAEARGAARPAPARRHRDPRRGADARASSSHVPNTEFAAAARAEHLLVIPAGDNVVRLLPPLIVTEADVAEAVARLEVTAAAVRRPRCAAPPSDADLPAPEGGAADSNPDMMC